VTLYIADISNYQAGIDINGIAQEGFAAVTCKATEGASFRDASFDTFIPQIQATGIIPGAYHYLRAGDGAAQARSFHSRVRDHGGPVGWLIQLDCESDGYGTEMQQWAAQWNQLTGSHPFLIYSGSFWWPRTGGFRGVDLTPYLWHAHYVSGTGTASALYAQVPPDWFAPGYGGWPAATFLQFTDSARVAGRSIDASAFTGNPAQLATLTASQGDDMAWTDQQISDVVYTLLGAPEGPIHVRDQLMRQAISDVAADVAVLKARPAGSVALTDADRTAIVNAITAKVDALGAKVDSVSAQLAAFRAAEAAAAQAEADKLKG